MVLAVPDEFMLGYMHIECPWIVDTQLLFQLSVSNTTPIKGNFHF